MTPPGTFLASSRNNIVGVEVTKNGRPYELHGSGSVLFTNPSGITTELTDGVEINQNRIQMRLPSGAYDQIGPIKMTIRIHPYGYTTTLGVIVGRMEP